MSLLSTERLYTGRIVNLDLDTVRFPDGSTGTARDAAASGGLRGGALSRSAGRCRSAGTAHPAVSPRGRRLHLGGSRRPAGSGGEPGSLRHAGARGGDRHAAGRLDRLTTIYTTPGFTDERIHLFLAGGLSAGTAAREADEFMELHTLRWSAVREMIRAGEVQDGKTLISLMFVQCYMR